MGDGMKTRRVTAARLDEMAEQLAAMQASLLAAAAHLATLSGHLAEHTGRAKPAPPAVAPREVRGFAAAHPARPARRTSTAFCPVPADIWWDAELTAVYVQCYALATVRNTPAADGPPVARVPGEFVTTREAFGSLSDRRVSSRTVWRRLHALAACGLVEIVPTGRWTRVQVCALAVPADAAEAAKSERKGGGM